MSSRIKSLKLLDYCIGGILIFCCRLIRPRKNISDIKLKNKITQNNKLKILFIRPGGLGDAVLLLPSINLLKQVYPGSQIDCLAEKRNYEILEINDDVNNVLLYDKNILKTLLFIHKTKYDVVIDTEQWHKLTSVITYLSRAPVRIGYKTNNRSALYTHSVSYRQDLHETDCFFNLIKTLFPLIKNMYVNTNLIKTPLKISSDHLNRFHNFKIGYEKIAGIFAGATVNERKWGADNFAMVAVRLIDDNIGIVLLGGKNEIPESKIIKRILGNKKILDFTANTSLGETTAIMSRLDLFISADTGLMHIASGLGLPTVSLFGAGIKPKWAPRGSHNILIDMELPCSPCTRFGYTPRCPINVKCLTEISVDDVYKACMRVINDVKE